MSANANDMPEGSIALVFQINSPEGLEYFKMKFLNILFATYEAGGRELTDQDKTTLESDIGKYLQVDLKYTSTDLNRALG